MVDTIAARSVYLETTNREFFRLNYNDTSLSLYRHVGTIPVGSFILSVKAYVETAFNGGTTNVLSVGTTFANANELLAAGDVVPGTVGYTEGARGRGTQLTQVASIPEQVGNQFYDTTKGGVGLYAKYSSTGTAPTAGSALVVVEYAAPANT